METGLASAPAMPLFAQTSASRRRIAAVDRRQFL
jgi:hypothetical protein